VRRRIELEYVVGHAVGDGVVEFELLVADGKCVATAGHLSDAGDRHHGQSAGEWVL
jgi:hypothetical protein